MHRVLLIVGMIGLLIGPPTAAHAKGNSIQIDRLYYRAGETVTARLGYYGAGRAELAPHGPYYLWLTPDRDAALRPPPLGRGAIRLGEVRFLGENWRRAEATFVVPAVEPGPYTLQVCNHPCTRTIDVDSTTLKVALNPLKAQLIDRIELLREELARVSKQARKAKALAAEQRRELSTLHTLAARLQLLTGRVEDLEQTASPPLDRPDEPPAIPGWIPIAGLLAATLAGYGGGRLAARRWRRAVSAAPPAQETLTQAEDELIPTGS